MGEGFEFGDAQELLACADDDLAILRAMLSAVLSNGGGRLLSVVFPSPIRSYLCWLD